MKRIILQNLYEWRFSPIRKPLLIRGARQVGKTYVVREFGKNFEQFVEVNFEKNPEAIKIFERDLDPVRIARDLSIMFHTLIKPSQALLFFDEIQQAPQAITALRYFHEELPELHVIAAGSLVDFAIEKVGIPVGRINYLFMFPMSFLEFLYARGYPQLAVEIVQHTPDQLMNSALHTLAMDLLGEYLAIGGMPDVVYHWIKKHDIFSCAEILQNISQVYQDDFAKYAKKHEIKYLDLIFKKFPLLISQSFKYSLLATEYRKRELEPALELLEKAQIIHRVFHNNAQGFPLAAGMNLEQFKLIPVDIGLNQAILGLDLSQWFLNPSMEMINKGQISEAYVGQELLAYANAQQKQQLSYWRREKSNSHAEVDYVVTIDNQIIPLEVKSGKGTSLQSMHVFLKEHQHIPYGIRFSTHNYSIFDHVHSYPLYAVAAISGDKTKLLQFLQQF